MRMGIDIGSCYIKAVALDPSGRMVDHHFGPHNGQPLEAIRRFRQQLREDVTFAGVTGSLSNLLSRDGNHRIDDVRSMIRGSAHLDGSCRNILHLGASSISLMKVSEEGELLDFRTNSVCAAGTGSFLDQQADRMTIGISECSRFKGVDDPPSVAARCAVFAKSDLIHRQQEGYTIPELWCGLCRGLSFTIANTLLLGEPLRGKTGVIGGVALNNEVVRWLRQVIGQDLFVIEHPHLVAAIGAALLARDGPAQEWAAAPACTAPLEPRHSPSLRPPLLLEYER